MTLFKWNSWFAQVRQKSARRRMSELATSIPVLEGRVLLSTVATVPGTQSSTSSSGSSAGDPGSGSSGSGTPYDSGSSGSGTSGSGSGSSGSMSSGSSSGSQADSGSISLTVDYSPYSWNDSGSQSETFDTANGGSNQGQNQAASAANSNPSSPDSAPDSAPPPLTTNFQIPWFASGTTNTNATLVVVDTTTGNVLFSQGVSSANPYQFWFSAPANGGGTMTLSAQLIDNNTNASFASTTGTESETSITINESQFFQGVQSPMQQAGVAAANSFVAGLTNAWIAETDQIAQDIQNRTGITFQQALIVTNQDIQSASQVANAYFQQLVAGAVAASFPANQPNPVINYGSDDPNASVINEIPSLSSQLQLAIGGGIFNVNLNQTPASMLTISNRFMIPFVETPQTLPGEFYTLGVDTFYNVQGSALGGILSAGGGVSNFQGGGSAGTILNNSAAQVRVFATWQLPDVNGYEANFTIGGTSQSDPNDSWKLSNETSFGLEFKYRSSGSQ